MSSDLKSQCGIRVARPANSRCRRDVFTCSLIPRGAERENRTRLRQGVDLLPLQSACSANCRGGGDRTRVWRNQNPLSSHLTTPQSLRRESNPHGCGYGPHRPPWLAAFVEPSARIELARATFGKSPLGRPRARASERSEGVEPSPPGLECLGQDPPERARCSSMNFA